MTAESTLGISPAAPPHESAPRRAPRSVSVRLLRSVLGLYCLVAVAATVLHLGLERRAVEQRVLDDLRTLTLAYADTVAGQVWQLDLGALHTTLTGITGLPQVAGAMVVDPRGQLVDGVGTLAPADAELQPSALTASFVRARSARRYAATMISHEHPLLATEGGRVELVGTLRLYRDAGAIDTEMHRIITSIGGAAVVKTLALWLLFVFFARSILGRPLERLVARIDSLPLNRSVRDDDPADRELDEVGLLDRTLTDAERALADTLHALHAANEELGRDNGQLARALEQSPTAIALCDADGVVTYVNPSFEAQHGIYARRGPGSPLGELLASSRGIRAAERVRRAIETEMPCHFDTEGPSRTGHRHGLARLAPIRDARGLLVGFVLAEEDVTVLKAAEERLRRQSAEQQTLIETMRELQAQMVRQEKLASLGQLAAGVAHEINNPVGFVRANLDTLARYYASLLAVVDAHHGGDPAAIAAATDAADLPFLRDDLPGLLAETSEGLDRVRAIVADLKVFARSDSARMERTDLHACIESTLNIAANEVKYRADVVRDYGAVPEIECIPTQLGQVLMNLVVNAAQAMDRRGTITVRTRAGDGSVVVEVTDDGPGISPETQARIFDPFFTTKAPGQGTGLGLAIVHGIVERHHGRIEVESTVGAGTTMRVTLPIDQPDVGDVATASPTTSPASGD
ncbi:MAG: PAS domain-containing protein [Ectothiorhodospiraceae bacterium]|nr:PAS domain-containing protein [Ectothiorhodospiraceae bacterium]